MKFSRPFSLRTIRVLVAQAEGSTNQRFPKRPGDKETYGIRMIRTVRIVLYHDVRARITFQWTMGAHPSQARIGHLSGAYPGMKTRILSMIRLDCSLS